MTYPTTTDPIGSIAPQSDAVEGPPGTWTGGTLDSAAAVIEPLRLGALDIMAYLGLSGDAANPTGNVTQLIKALTLWAASSTASVASASTLTLPTTGAFITVTGTTQIDDVALPVSPLTTRLVILKAASDGLVLKNLNHQKLGADVTLNTDQTLVLFCTGSFWYPLGAVSGAALTNPMSALDDMIVGGTSGTPARLAKGTDGQVLTVDPTTHHITWANSASGFSNPMTSLDDVIVGGTAGTATRLAKGTDGQVLTVDPTTHHLVWATPTALTNPMTTAEDLIKGGVSGAPARLAKGADGQVLTIDPSTHAVVWANSASGFANPMVATGDLIKGGASGTAARLAIGSTGNVLTVSGGAPVWAAPSGGGGGGFGQLSPLSPPEGTTALPTWINQGGATATDESDGLYLLGVADVNNQIRGKYHSYTAPQTITAAFLPFLRGNGNSNVGISITDGTSNAAKAINFEFIQSSAVPKVAVEYWTAVAGGSVSNTQLVEISMHHGPMIWMQIEDDNTNLIFRLSSDGVHFPIVVLTVGRTAHLTPSHAGIMTNAFGATVLSAMKCLHWSIA